MAGRVNADACLAFDSQSAAFDDAEEKEATAD
jgi:hypothetical protein